MGESYSASGILKQRKRTVSDCTGSHTHTAAVYFQNGFSDNNNLLKLNEESISRKRLTFHIAYLTVIFLVLISSICVVFMWKNETTRKHVFLPQVEQLAITTDDDGERESPLLIDTDGGCEGDNALGVELEAASAIHAALEMKGQGKLGKAQKLFQHAMIICPKHADVLTHYGEFHEDTRNDFLMADHLYLQALTYSPTHSKALVNRRRTSPVVEEIDERRLQKIEDKLKVLISIPESNSALRRVKKEAYFQHIFHTVGLEGNTMSLQHTRMIIETRMAVGGKSIMEHNEILGLDEAMKFINSTLIHRIGGISMDDILAIHKHVMAFVDPNQAGHFRHTQVYVGSHVPPAPDEINLKMNDFVEWLNSEEAASLHPIHFAAIAHYKLVHIHPFVDGNGRTSRLLMNFILMQAGYPPVIIRKQDRHLYYEHLNTANNGDVRPFIRFVSDCTEKTIDVYLWASRELEKFHILGPTENDQTVNHFDENSDYVSKVKPDPS